MSRALIEAADGGIPIRQASRPTIRTGRGDRAPRNCETKPNSSVRRTARLEPRSPRAATSGTERQEPERPAVAANDSGVSSDSAHRSAATTGRREDRASQARLQGKGQAVIRVGDPRASGNCETKPNSPVCGRVLKRIWGKRLAHNENLRFAEAQLQQARRKSEGQARRQSGAATGMKRNLHLTGENGGLMRALTL